MKSRNYGQEIFLNRFQIIKKLLIRRFFLSLFFSLPIASAYFFYYLPQLYFKLLGEIPKNIKVLVEVFIKSKFKRFSQKLLDDIYLCINISLPHIYETLIVLGVSTFVIFSLLTFLFYKYGKKEGETKVLRGQGLLKKRSLVKSLKKYKKTFSSIPLYFGKEKIPIPLDFGGGHFSILGASGTGKTQCILSLIEQIRTLSQKALIVDPGGEYYSKIGKKNDVILSLYDKRSQLFDFWSEGVDLNFISKALIETQGEASSQSFWSKAGQSLFYGMMSIFHSQEELFEAFFHPYSELKSKLKEKRQLASSLLGHDELASSVFASAAVDLNFLGHMNYWPKKEGRKIPFSLTSWTKDDSDRRFVFLISNEEHWESSKHLIRLWFDLACLGSLGRQISRETPHLWMISDEISKIGRLPTLPLIPDVGRKYNTHLVAGFQAISQFEHIYGRDKTRSILQGFQNNVFFRANEESLKKHMSDVCGDLEIEESTQSVSFGKEDYNDRENLSKQRRLKKIFLPTEFSQLKNLEAVLKLPSLGPSKIHFQYKDFPNKYKASFSQIPSEDILELSKRQSTQKNHPSQSQKKNELTPKKKEATLFKKQRRTEPLKPYEEKIIALFEKKIPIGDISKQLQTNRSKIYRVLKKQERLQKDKTDTR